MHTFRSTKFANNGFIKVLHTHMQIRMNTTDLDALHQTTIDRMPLNPLAKMQSVRRQTLLNFMKHLKSNGFLRYSYPMPDQERGEGWMMFLYERLSDDIINSFEA